MNAIKNKIMMDLTNVVIHCQTEGLAKKVLAKAHEMGYKWGCGQSFLDETYWASDKEGTCYNIEEGTHYYLDWYKDKSYKIISAEEFLNDGKKVYYRGNEERGEEIIKALESIGGANKYGYYGNCEGLVYYIGRERIINRCAHISETLWLLQQAGYTEAHLPTEETITIEGRSFTLSAIKKALGL